MVVDAHEQNQTVIHFELDSEIDSTVGSAHQKSIVRTSVAITSRSFHTILADSAHILAENGILVLGSIS